MSESADQARTRRRWISLAEFVAVAGLVIAALGFWNSWSERRDAQADRAQAAQDAAKKSRYVLRGEVASDKAVKLTRDENHPLSEARVSFPKALGVGPEDALADSINADWFAKPLLKLTDGGPDERTGRLPVLITYTYNDADGEHRGSGIYDVIWQTRAGTLPLQGRRFTIANFRLRHAGGSQTELDRLWTKP